MAHTASLKPGFAARWSVVSRVLAGTLGAYGLAALATATLSLLLATMGMGRVEAVIAATLPSFAIFSVAAMTAFHARSALRAWSWLAVFALPTGIGFLLMLPE